MASKRCTKCKEERPLEEFHVLTISRDGRRSHCKKCRSRRKIELPKPVCTHKMCTSCGIDKSLSDFYVFLTGWGGVRSRCKDCLSLEQKKRLADPTVRIQRNKRILAGRYADPTYHQHERDALLVRRYGITRNQYNVKLACQNNVCAICGHPEQAVDSRTGKLKQLAVDHNHSNGKVRGLLCGSCNRGMGLFRENFDNLLKAAKYIQEYEGVI